MVVPCVRADKRDVGMTRQEKREREVCEVCAGGQRRRRRRNAASVVLDLQTLLWREDPATPSTCTDR